MKPRLIDVGICLAIGSCLILAGAQVDSVRDATPDPRGVENTLNSALQNDAPDMCFDHPDPGALAEAGAGRSVPDQPLFWSPAGSQAAYLLRPDHDPSDWSGSLKKFPLEQEPAGQVKLGAALWDAGALLTGMPASQRNIHTLRLNPAPAGVQSQSTVPFTWAMLAPQQRAALDRAPDSGIADGLGERRLDFLRGDRSLEIGQPGGIFRRRATVLGDAIHGTPLPVGAPSPGIVGAPYAAFFNRHARRPAAVYLGANDGMLHAFDAGSGRELFAYVPNLVLPSLNQLSSTHYVHKAYVDGALDAAEALVDGQWKTVLVAGLGGGARGVFALDISAPDQFEQGGGALWEFGSNDDAAIGHVVAAPSIAKFRVTAQQSVPSHRYFAVLAGGTDRAGQGGGALFLLALDKPAAARWRPGVNYVKLTPPSAASAGAGAELAPPALALDLDGAVRYAYAGDLLGNLWRFDFSGKAMVNTPVQLLFVARDAAGVRQPITQAPNVVLAPGGGFLVLFGTGKLNQGSDKDPANFKPQSFYAIHDEANSSNSLVPGRAVLAARTLGGDAAGAAGFAIVDADPGPGRKQGWYLDFPQAASTGERSVSRAQLAGGKVVFNTVLPGTAPCTVAGMRTYAIDALTGLADAINSPSGAVAGLHRMPLPALVGVLEAARSVGPREATGRALVRQRHLVLNVDSTGAIDTTSVIGLPAPAKRLHWREIANWPELHQASKQ